jgi:hypothetical protein
MFASYLADRELISRIYNELKILNTEIANNLMNKWANELNRYFIK